MPVSRGARGAPGARGSDVSKCCSDPPSTRAGSIWPSFGVPLGCLWLPSDCLWLSLAVLWGPFGLPWDPLRRTLDFLQNARHLCEQMCQNHSKMQQDIAFWNLPPETPETPEAAEVVSASAAQTPLSTRAGGQDDGSTQTPSNDFPWWDLKFDGGK